MTKANLKDTSFLIYTRIDSEDRLMNLELLISHIQRYFHTTLVLWEIASVSSIPKRIKKSHDLSYRFIEDINPVLHTTKYRNQMVQHCRTPYFYISDTDVIFAPGAILSCTEHLRKVRGKALVYPYNGDFFNVPKEIRKEYSKTGDYDFLRTREGKFTLWFKYSTGGIFGGQTVDFMSSGPDNEAIFGWGPDDLERYYRLKMNGFCIKRSNTPLYHFDHERKSNSWYFNEDTRRKNDHEYLSIFQNLASS